MRQIDSSETKKRILFCTILTFLEVIWSEIRESALNVTQTGSVSIAKASSFTLEGVRLEWNTFIGIFENLEKKAAKYMQKHENKLKIL